jgi:YggT family protein
MHARRAGAAEPVDQPGGLMDVILVPIIQVLNMALQLYLFAIIASAIISWLIAFDVINTTNRLVYTIVDFLWRITEPALRPIRQFLPNLGGIDISPIILILGIILVQNILTNLAIQFQGGMAGGM